jgi:hypothetical protein
MGGQIIFFKQSGTFDVNHRNMKSGLFSLIKRAFGREPALHPVEHGMARRWIKQRLIAVFPELRNNPAALERAYRTLGLEPRPGQGGDEAETVFELKTHAEP